MRAKTVNESIGFERYRDPKTALGFRNYNLVEEFNKVGGSESDWAYFLETTFVGKRVTGFMAKGDSDSFGSFHEQTTKNPIEFIHQEDVFPDFSFITIEPGTYVHNEDYEYEYDPDQVFYYVDMAKQVGKEIVIKG